VDIVLIFLRRQLCCDSTCYNRATGPADGYKRPEYGAIGHNIAVVWPWLDVVPALSEASQVASWPISTVWPRKPT